MSVGGSPEVGRGCTAATGELALPGVRLYYEVRGNGPPLLLIPTGNGDAAPYVPLARALADRYTVITYDRRGYSRSPIDAPVDDQRRVETDSDDAAALLAHLTDRRAHVLGGSSGAIVALALLTRYPARIGTLVAHEPPLASVLPDAHRWLRFYEDIYSTYRSSGVPAARDAFRAGMGMIEPTRPPADSGLGTKEFDEMVARVKANQPFWMEHELRQYPATVIDIAALARLSRQLVLAGGTTSTGDAPYRPNLVLAGLLGAKIVHFPGGHVGYVTHPAEFADALHRTLRTGAC